MDIKKNPSIILLILQNLFILFLIYQVHTLNERVSQLQGTGKRVQNRRPPGPKKVNVDMASVKRDSAIRGRVDAKRSVVKFNSFTCIFCKRSKAVVEQVLKNHSDNLNIIYKHYVRNRQDFLAGNAAECAGEQGKFWEMYDTIFDKGPGGDFKAYAKTLGLNSTKFSKCQESGRYKKKMIDDTRFGSSLGVDGTPAFIINNMLHVGYMPLEVFENKLKSN